MKNALFKNVGKDIKDVAEAEANSILAKYVLIGIVIVLCGFALIAEGYAIGCVGFIIALVVIIYGYRVSRLAVMFLYAYGEIADRLISLDTKTANNRKLPKSPTEVPVTPKKKDRQDWECQFCGHKNSAGAMFCESCNIENIDT